MTGALATGCGGNDGAGSCGTSEILTGVAWAPGVYGAVAVGGGVWFDPGDGWTPDPGDVGDGTGDDGSGAPGTADGPAAGDGSSGDGSGGDGAGGGGDGAGGGGDGGDALRLHLATTGISVAPDAAGCYACVMVCTTDGVANVSHAARGVSGESAGAACTNAVSELEDRVHASESHRLGRCARAADLPPPTERQPASPTIVASSLR